jgi:hypothetical protein
MTNFGDKPFSLNEVKLTNLANTVQVDLPTPQVLSFSERVISEELAGGGKIAAVATQSIGVDWSLGGGGISLEAYALLTGRTVSSVGSTPNQTKTLTGDNPKSFPYIRIYGKSLGEGDDDVHCKIYKAKLTKAMEGRFEYGKFFITSCNGIGVADSSGKAYEFVQNETAADLPDAEGGSGS